VTKPGFVRHKHKMTEQIGALANTVDSVKSAVDGQLLFAAFILLTFWNWHCHKTSLTLLL